MSGRRATWGLAAAALICLILPAAASATTTLGSSLAFNGSGGAQSGCTPICTFIPTAINSGNPVTAPFDGVIVRWGASAADAIAAKSTVRLRVVHSPAPNQWVGVRSGPTEHTDAGFVTKFFDLNPGLPIAAGDYIGVDTERDDGSNTGSVLRGQVGSSFADFTTQLPDGGAPQVKVTTPGLEVYMQAIAEPDADHDGFGDETQDQCPSQASTQGPCPPTPPLSAQTSPTPTAKRKCKKRRKHAAIARKRCRKHKRR